jgi:hypothetical protein
VKRHRGTVAAVVRPFAVEKAEERCHVAFAGGRTEWYGLFGGGECARVEVDGRGAQGFCQLAPGACPDERDDVRALGGDPGDGQLGHGDSVRRRCSAERLDERQVVGQVGPLEAGQCVAEVLGGQLPLSCFGPVTGEQPARKGSVSCHGDAQFPGGQEDLLLYAAGEERVLDLHVGDGMDRVGPAQRGRADLGQADAPDVSGLDQLAEGADRLLDRHFGIGPSGPVDVDVVGAQPAQ